MAQYPKQGQIVGSSFEEFEARLKKSADMRSGIGQVHVDAQQGPNVPEGKWATSSGATSRSHAPAYDLVPMELEKAAINRFQYGIDHGHEKNNWRKGLNDPKYAQERMNHAVEHLKRANSGVGTWEDIEAVICNLAMLCWYKVWGTAVHTAFPHLFQTGAQQEASK